MEGILEVHVLSKTCLNLLRVCTQQSLL